LLLSNVSTPKEIILAKPNYSFEKRQKELAKKKKKEEKRQQKLEKQKSPEAEKETLDSPEDQS
jgi:hypothetical protein